MARKRRRDKGHNPGWFLKNCNNVPAKKPRLTEEDEARFEKIRRHKRDVWTLARDEDVNSTPGRLRPLPAGPTEVEKLEVGSSKVEENISEDRQFHVPLLMNLINDFLQQHSQESSACFPQCVMPPDGEQPRGFVFKETLKCARCGFKIGPVKLYEESERLPGRSIGPKPAKKNVQFAIGLTKVGIGITGAKTLISSMDSRTPTLSTMHNLMTGVCDSMENILKMSLEENRRKLRDALKLRGWKVEEGKPIAVAASADACFNNPSFYGVSQRATQAVFPVFEAETPEQLLIGWGFANKLCKKGEMLRAEGVENPCPGHDGHCSANFKAGEPIAAYLQVTGLRTRRSPHTGWT
ncbi:PREDICTED: uncharacterized protein LOC109486912 [Branchiostoma belcheri]|uniref:Uncharacterized protein LOC109486912 n=1 Tax=Branchiostoma belcheri TaxID=7741 RepID=A0A6P5AJD8_BRABE|nr:PREDICTED: uncharacterized protein LOC109486912 [Branchiostoma belcheri]